MFRCSDPLRTGLARQDGAHRLRDASRGLHEQALEATGMMVGRWAKSSRKDDLVHAKDDGTIVSDHLELFWGILDGQEGVLGHRILGFCSVWALPAHLMTFLLTRARRSPDGSK